MRSRVRRGSLWAVAAIVAGSIGGLAGTAAATSFNFVNTGAPIPANFSYYSSRQSHWGVDMSGCQSPGNWSARVRDTTGGSGAQIRNLSGACNTMSLFWGTPDTDTRVWCYNQTSSSKYAYCTQYYS